jgi:hypothetical protein
MKEIELGNNYAILSTLNIVLPTEEESPQVAPQYYSTITFPSLKKDSYYHFICKQNTILVLCKFKKAIILITFI